MRLYELDFLRAAESYHDFCRCLASYWTNGPDSEASKNEALEFRGTLRGLSNMLTEIADFLANDVDSSEDAANEIKEVLRWLPEQINFYDEDNTEATRRISQAKQMAREQSLHRKRG